ncbi:plasmid stabilization system protein ParE [Gillisia sp. Hel_I_86]|uniref:type II toxin-antitoxin system RelE/ParE family toxin n=1 Tax=Gillisia sp. Hel_I_86 TaxID=1249981 RepID=UPI00119BBAF1|nr:type II toxin-antitoxin system RelE/ParE family toxin [Gillisia sp. Hel_I_86]TVZ27652.1 plasmid stabilization system protein ParE [Gillisia sp. Hel_I_86]
MKVFLSALAESKLLELNEFLLENWSKKVRDNFIEKLSKRIKQISSQPESCPKSTDLKGLFKCVVTKQTTFYYRISNSNKEIEIITIFDTRQNPKKIKKDIR